MSTRGRALDLDADVVRHLQEVLEWPVFTDDRYEVLGELGRGGLARVYLARDAQLGREVAIKVTTASVVDRDAIRSLEEARMMSRLEHPGIVPVYDAGQLEDGRTYYVMRRVRGSSLEQYCAERDVTLGGLLRVFDQICDAISFAHDAGVVHCDLTPRNVMIGGFGEVFVMDWGGAARTTATHGAPRLELIATPGFCAPEQLDPHAPPSPRMDVFALGRLLEHCVQRHSALHPQPMLGGRTLGHRGFAPLRAVVARATAASPDERYASVAELAADVRGFASGERVSAYTESRLEQLLRLSRPHAAILALALAYVVIRAVLILLR